MKRMTFSAWSSVLKPMCQKILSTKWSMPLLKIYSFLAIGNQHSKQKQQYKWAYQDRATKDRQCLHFNLSLHQPIEGILISVMPGWHVKVLDQKRTDSLIQDQIQKVPAIASTIKYGLQPVLEWPTSFGQLWGDTPGTVIIQYYWVSTLNWGCPADLLIN